MTMKMNAESATLFASDIAKAKASGNSHWAKAVCCPAMRFGKTLDEAVCKASKDAAAAARKAGCAGMPPSVQSGAL